MHARSWVALSLSFCLLPLASASGASKPKGNATFSHPWMPVRDIGYQHSPVEIYRHDDKDFDVLFTRYHERYELRGDGGTTTTLRWSLRTRDDGRMPRYLRVATLSSVRNTRVESFRAVLKTSQGVENIGEDRLIEVGADAYQDYISDARRLFLLLPERKTGTLDFEVTLVEDPDPEVSGYFGGLSTLQVGAAVSDRVIEVAVPADVQLRFEKRYFEAPIQSATASGTTTHTLRVNALRPLYWSSGMPHFADAYPLLAWSNQPSWAAYGRAMGEPWKAKLGVGEAGAGKAKELAAAAGSVRDAALAIHDFVADGWTYLGFYPGQSGWVPHDAQAVWDSRIGDCKDQTALMVSMLRAADIEAYPAIGWAGTGEGFTTTEIPLSLANHAFVFVVDEAHPAGGFFLNSTDVGFAATPQGPWMGGRDAVVFFEGDREPELIAIPPSTAEARARADLTRLLMQPDGSARVEFRRSLAGDEAAWAYARHRDAGPADAEGRLRAAIEARFPGAEIESATQGPDPEVPGRWLVEGVAIVPGWASVTGELRSVALPWATRYGAAPPSAFGDLRSHPRALSGFLHDQRFEVVIPEGAGLVSVPDAGEHEWQNWTASLASEPQGRTVRVTLRAEETPGRMFRRDEERRKDFYRWLSETQGGTVVYRQKDAQ